MNDRPRPKGFRYYLHDGSSAFRFVLKGSLTADDVNDLEQCRRTAASILRDRPFLVDLNALTECDEPGHALLQSWHGAGALLVASTPRGKLLLHSVTGKPAIDAVSAARAFSLPESLRRFCLAVRGWRLSGSPLR